MAPLLRSSTRGAWLCPSRPSSLAKAPGRTLFLLPPLANPYGLMPSERQDGDLVREGRWAVAYRGVALHGRSKTLLPVPGGGSSCVKDCLGPLRAQRARLAPMPIAFCGLCGERGQPAPISTPWSCGRGLKTAGYRLGNAKSSNDAYHGYLRLASACKHRRKAPGGNRIWRNSVVGVAFRGGVAHPPSGVCNGPQRELDRETHGPIP